MKIASKINKLTALRQKFHQNIVLLEGLSEKVLQSIESIPIDDEDGR